MNPMIHVGRTFIGTAAIGAAIVQLTTGEFVRLIPALPGWMPWPVVWPYLTGVLALASGVALIAGILPRLASGTLVGMILFSFVFQHVPVVIGNPSVGFMWTNPAKVVALAAGILLLGYITQANSRNPPQPPDQASVLPSLLAAVSLGVFLVICGIQHFVYAGFVIDLVPSWMPMRTFWAYFTGIALIAGGIGVVVPRTARIAGILTSLMIFAWVVVLHIPRAIATSSAFETAGVLEALALSGVALLIACSKRQA